MASASIEHIEVDSEGIARIVGRRTRVTQIVMDKRFQGWDADEIHRQYPYLLLSEIHAAFAYYYDHQAELDAQIDAEIIRVNEMRAQTPEPPIVERLRQLRKSS